MPRVGLVGLMEGAPHSAPLLGYVREHVADLEVPWLTEATAGKYLTLKINAVQTTAPTTQSEVANGNKLRPNGHGVKLEATEKPTDVPMIVD